MTGAAFDPRMLTVVAPFNNPMRWRSRLANFRRFEDGMLAAGVRLVTVELAYGDRPFELPDRDGVQRVRLRSGDVLWHKENLVNIGFAKGGDWEYGAAIDGDFMFPDPNWASETVHMLQVRAVAQISSDLVFTGPHGEHIGAMKSYMAMYQKTRGRVRSLDQVMYNITIPITPDSHGYPGGAWAWRRAAFHALGGLLDVCIVGAGDQHIAWALTGSPDPLAEPSRTSTGYSRAVTGWRDRAAAAIRRDVGCVPCLALHLWHGNRQDRKYPSRWQILEKNAFDPETDLVRDRGGLIGLAGNKPHLRDDLIAYFQSRNEDSVDLAEGE